MANQRLCVLLLCAAFGCAPNVVDAVTEPAFAPPPLPPSPLEGQLIHRYSFDEAGSDVLDSKGAAHGTAVGTTQPGDGTLPLLGTTSNQYVNLPNRLISGLRDATFEAWLTWEGGMAWQRIFDFGTNVAGEDVSGSTGTSYLFLTTAGISQDPLPSALRVAYSNNGVADETLCQGQAPFPVGVATQVAVVVNEAGQTLALFQDGVLLSEVALTRPLSAIEDVNNWLGRSNYIADDELAGSFDEFRIYGAALSPLELENSFAAGPNAGRE